MTAAYPRFDSHLATEVAAFCRSGRQARRPQQCALAFPSSPLWQAVSRDRHLAVARHRRRRRRAGAVDARVRGADDQQHAAQQGSAEGHLRRAGARAPPRCCARHSAGHRRRPAGAGDRVHPQRGARPAAGAHLRRRRQRRAAHRRSPTTPRPATTTASASPRSARDRFIVKVPLTPAGLLAARRLHDDGIRHQLHARLLGAPELADRARWRSRPACNVFMGRINAFVADNELGDGKNVGEKATLASQRGLRAAARSKPARRARRSAPRCATATRSTTCSGSTCSRCRPPPPRASSTCTRPVAEVVDRTGDDPDGRPSPTASTPTPSRLELLLGDRSRRFEQGACRGRRRSTPSTHDRRRPAASPAAARRRRPVPASSPPTRRRGRQGRQDPGLRQLARPRASAARRAGTAC